MSFKSRESLWPFLVVAKVMIQTAGSWNWHSNKLPDNGLFELSSACFANAFHIAVYFFCLFRPDNDVNRPNLCAGQLHSTMTRLSPSIIFVKLIMQIFSATSNNRPFRTFFFNADHVAAFCLWMQTTGQYPREKVHWKSIFTQMCAYVMRKNTGKLCREYRIYKLKRSIERELLEESNRWHSDCIFINFSLRWSIASPIWHRWTYLCRRNE